MAPGGWLVLCSASDASALWVYDRLLARGRAVSLLATESLADVCWEHRVADGGATLALTDVDGVRIEGHTVGAVLNRLMTAPLAALELAAPGDRDYAGSELTAFASSWLRALSAKIVNRPNPQGLAGRWRPPLQWRVLAARAGVPTAALDITSSDPAAHVDGHGTWVLAVDGRVLHPGATIELHRAVGRLSRRVDASVLGLRFAGSDPAADGWRMLDATLQPDLSLAGEAGVRALEQVLAP